MVQAKCSHRDAKVKRRYYDKNGHPRVKHAFLPCRNAAARVDVYGKGYCDEHLSDGDFGYDPGSVDLDALLGSLIEGNKP
jgi:hypothetical protein